MKSLLMILCWLFFASVSHAEEILTFNNGAERQLYQQLTAELRCPQCQNQNIADSNAVVAVDMREKTFQLIREGKSRQQILDYMVNRYGDFAHYQPPVNKLTLWLWVAPLVMLIALLLFGAYRRQAANNSQSSAASESLHTSSLDKAKDAELDKLIDRYRSKK
ncbi:cytochrome c-type biogenesis protein [Rheinheimera sp. WS51]|uniref:cytochrome c-type biogenesis protein n=1 Tax=Rheinheimera sp. WS51 TaxID=3425886 RepID=UPI003D900539